MFDLMAAACQEKIAPPLYLYHYGNQYILNSGGWQVGGYAYIKDDYLDISTGVSGGQTIKSDIDFAPYNTLRIQVQLKASGGKTLGHVKVVIDKIDVKSYGFSSYAISSELETWDIDISDVNGKGKVMVNNYRNYGENPVIAWRSFVLLNI